MGDNAKQAGSMRRRGVGAAKEGRHIAWGGKTTGGSLRQRVNQPVSAPVGGRQRGTIAEMNVADGGVRLVRGHPHNLARGNQLSDVTIEHVGDSAPNPGKRSVVMSGASGASFGSGEERKAVGADGGDKGTLSENHEQRPGLSSGGSVAPRGRPSKPIRHKVAQVGDSSNAESRASDGRPFPVHKRAIAVPGEVLLLSIKIGRRDQPSEGAVGLPRRHGNPDGKEPMQLQVPGSLDGEMVTNKRGGGRGEGPAPRREGGRAAEPVLKGANSAEAKLTPIVIDVEGRDGSLASLSPLPTTDSGGEITSALVVPAASDLARKLTATIAFDERADGAGTGHQDTSVLGEGQIPNVRP